MSKISLASNPLDDATIRKVVTGVFNSLQPHAQRAKVFRRDGDITISFEMPRDVKVTRRHFALVATKARGAHCWVEWMDMGLRLCIKLVSPSPQGTKRKQCDSTDGNVHPELKKQCSNKEC